jgi:hypothetical protein
VNLQANFIAHLCQRAEVWDVGFRVLLHERTRCTADASAETR